MNEKIKELAEQAGFEIEDGGHIMLHHIYLTDRMEKFAELLIEECCQICIDKWVEKISEDAKDCYLAIQEHFGIEE